MKKILSIKYGAGAFNFSILLLRVFFGVLLLSKHGYSKMVKFEELHTRFYSFLGMGSTFSLVLAIFAEVICAAFIILGLFTRLAAIPLIITMAVVVFGADAGKPLAESELAILYLGAFTTLLLCGPGKISVDGMINK
ncbi:DoxX family protein [Parafilimonas sp.]|uniref:DoxX family protein n=1 Tax=Parafilimonas sp. TaxID=1969739 RepID=UPI0039E6FD00